MYLPPRLSRALIRVADGVSGRRVWAAWRYLERTQWWDPIRLRQLQDEKLVARVGEAALTSPLLAARLRAAGLDPRRFRGRADLSSLPVLEREDLRRDGLRIFSRALPPDQVVPNSTGGSTGGNTRFMVDRACWRWRDAVDLRLWGFMGLAPGARVALLWGSPMDAGAALRLRERARRAVDNRRFFTALEIGNERLDRVLDWLARQRPDALFGYTSVLDAAARQALARGGMEGPRRVVASAEALFPEQRARMARAWGAEVFNLYGCREVGLVAMECAGHRGLHVMDERLIVERFGEDEDPADLLITDLDNRATPFIRYRIGDLAAVAPVGECPCGRGLSRIGEVAGRSYDVIRGAAGRRVSGTFWSFLLRGAADRVESWQVVQTGPLAVEVRLTPPGCLGDDARREILTRVRAALGEEMDLSFRELPRLEPLPSGKHRFVVGLPEQKP